MKPVYIRALGAVALATAAFFVIDDWRVFWGVYLMIWAYSVGQGPRPTCQTCEARRTIARSMVRAMRPAQREFFHLDTEEKQP